MIHIRIEYEVNNKVESIKKESLATPIEIANHMTKLLLNRQITKLKIFNFPNGYVVPSLPSHLTELCVERCQNIVITDNHLKALYYNGKQNILTQSSLYSLQKFEGLFHNSTMNIDLSAFSNLRELSLTMLNTTNIILPDGLRVLRLAEITTTTEQVYPSSLVKIILSRMSNLDYFVDKLSKKRLPLQAELELYYCNTHNIFIERMKKVVINHCTIKYLFTNFKNYIINNSTILEIVD